MTLSLHLCKKKTTAKACAFRTLQYYFLTKVLGHFQVLCLREALFNPLLYHLVHSSMSSLPLKHFEKLEWHLVECRPPPRPNSPRVNVSESESNGVSCSKTETKFVQAPHQLDPLQNVMGSSLAPATYTFPPSVMNIKAVICV